MRPPKKGSGALRRQEAIITDDRMVVASFAAGMQIAYADLQELTETLAGQAKTGHTAPTPEAAKAIRRDLEKMRRLLDTSQDHLDRIEHAAVGDRLT